MFTGFHGNVYDKMMMIMITMIIMIIMIIVMIIIMIIIIIMVILMIMVINIIIIIMIIMIILRIMIIIIMILTRKIQTHRCGSKKDNRLDFLYLRAPFVSQTPSKSQQTKRSPVRGTNHPSPVKIVTSSLHWWKCWMASSCFTILLYTSNCLR